MEKSNHQIEAMLKLESSNPTTNISSKAKKSSKTMKKTNSSHRIFYSSFDKQHTAGDILSGGVVIGSGGGPGCQHNRLVSELSDIPFALARRDYNSHSQVLNFFISFKINPKI